MSTATITAAVLAHNEAQMLPGCLSSLQWCSKILVLDQHSDDNTAEIAKQAGARVISSRESSFAKRREELLAECTTDWIFYIDADERVTPQLAQTVQSKVSDDQISAVSFPRTNYFFGKQFNHGGWQDEYVTRLFRVISLSGWFGDIHESPTFAGTVATISEPLWHFSHRSVADGLVKTAAWTPMEARLLAEREKERVGFWTIIRKGLGEGWRRGIRQGGWKDGEAGCIEVLTQMINRMLVYMQVWELQQRPPLSQNYAELEQQLKSLWQKELKQ